MDSTTRARIQARLTAEIEGMPPRMQQVAKYIIDRPADFGLDTIRTSADKIGASANTLVRMANHLGFDSFDELREPFRQTLVSGSSDDPAHAWISRIAQKGQKGAEHAKALRNEVGAFNRSLQLLTLETTEAVVGDLGRARRVFITATRSSYALAYYFYYIGRMALPEMKLVPSHMGSAIEDMVDLDSRDVLFAITFRPYSSETIQALRFANQRDANVVLMTDSKVIAPNITTDHLLEVVTQSTHHFGCYAGAMAVLDCLLAHLVKQGGASAAGRISHYEGLRQDSGAYWKATLPRVRV